MASDGKVVPVAEATGSADQGPEQLQDVTDEEQQGGSDERQHYYYSSLG